MGYPTQVDMDEVSLFQQVFVVFPLQWWARYNYILSASLSVGVAFCAIFLFFALQNNGHTLAWCGNHGDNCLLATCPTAPGISVPGCPVFSGAEVRGKEEERMGRNGSEISTKFLPSIDMNIVHTRIRPLMCDTSVCCLEIRYFK